MKTFMDHFHKQAYHSGNIFLPLSVWPYSPSFTLLLLWNTNTFFLPSFFVWCFLAKSLIYDT